MDLDSRRLFISLHNFAEDTFWGPDKTNTLLSKLNDDLTQEHVHSSLLDLYLFEIFEKNHGLLKFIHKVIHNVYFKNSTIQSLEIIYLLVNTFPTKLGKHIVDINDVCQVAIKSSASANVKSKALQLLELGFERINDKGVEHQNHYQEIFATLRFSISQNNCDTVRQKLFTALGMFALKFRYIITDADDVKGLKKLFHNSLGAEIYRKNIADGISYIFTGLQRFCESFPLNSEQDQTIILDLYKYSNIIINKKGGSRTPNVAALTFFAHNITIFRPQIMPDYIKWHKKLSKWLDQPYLDEKKAAMYALKPFYQVIGDYLEQSPNPNPEIIQHFLKIFKGRIEKPEIQNEKMHMAIQGIRFFSGAFHRHLSDDEITNFHKFVMQRFEKLFVLEENPQSDEWEFLPHYIQTVSHLMKYHTFSSSELFGLQKAVINMIKFFPQLPPLQHHFVVDSLVVTFFELKDQEHFVETIIYQGTIWTCSHQHLALASVTSAEEIITMKNFLPMWLGLLRSTSNRSYDQDGIHLDDRKCIISSVVKKLLKTLMILTNKLNVNVNLKEEMDQAIYQVEQTNDLAIFLNVVDFYQEILTVIDSKLLKACINKLINLYIAKCLKYPLISGFYKLLRSFLGLANDLEYFEGTDQDVEICRENLDTFMRILLKEMTTFKDELLVAALHVLLKCPLVIVKNLLAECLPVFTTAFSVGKKYIALAVMGLDTLEEWQRLLPADLMEPFLLEIVPCLDTFLRSKSLAGLIETDTNRKRRKTAPVLKKRHVVLEIEPELLLFQKRVLHFVGQQSNAICRAFTAVDYLENDSWCTRSHLKISLPYEDLKLSISLDAFVPRIVELALNSPDNQIRTTACELLHGVVMVFLGKSKPMNQSAMAEVAELLRHVAMPLLQLGCDVDPVVQQLFQPLFLQIIHWYTSTTQLRSCHTAIILEILMEAITHPTDSALRDFAGICINEFIKWTIKQTSRAGLAKDPINIKIVIKKMRFFSTHPDPHKKLATYLILNNIYKELREEEDVVNLFWIEICHIVISGLDLIDYEVDETSAVKIKACVGHVQRVFVEKRRLFNEADGKRRIPLGIHGTTLRDVAGWLLFQTGSNSKYCRETVMVLFSAVAPLVAGFRNMPTFIEGVAGDPAWISKVYLRENLVAQPRNFDNASSLFQWMQALLCALDGYNFVLKNGAQLTLQYDSKVFQCIDFFLTRISAEKFDDILGANPTSIEKDRFNVINADLVVALLTLSNSIVNNCVQTGDLLGFWSPPLWRFIANVTFNHRVLKTDNYEGILQTLMNNLPRKLPEVHSKNLTETLRKYMEANIQICVDLHKPIIALPQRSFIKGVLLLQNCAVNAGLDCQQFSGGLSKIVFGSFCERVEDNRVFLNVLPETTVAYCMQLLKFALVNDEEFSILVDCLHKPYTVQSMDSGCGQKIGLFFLDLFDDLVGIIAEKFELFLSLALNKKRFQETVDIIAAILKSLVKNKHSKDLIKSVAETLVRRWKLFEDFFNTDRARIGLGMNFVELLLPVCLNQSLNSLPAGELNIIGNWLATLLDKQFWTHQDKLDASIEIFLLLVELGDCDKLRQFLTTMQQIFDSQSTLSETRTFSFNKLATCLPSIKSVTIFKWLLSNLLDLSLEFTDLLKDNLRRTNEDYHRAVLREVYQMCFDEDDHNLSVEAKLKIARNVITPLYGNCSLECFEQFYVENITKILDILKTPVSETNIVLHIIHFILIEVMFLRLPVGSKDRPVCPITNKAMSSDQKNNPKLMMGLLKLSFDDMRVVLPINEDDKELLRLYKCYAYNASVSIVCNSIKDAKFYKKLFTRREENGDKDILWENLVDTDKTYAFVQAFETLPKERKVLVNIRKALRVERSPGHQTNSLKYLESVRMFNSSLCDDIVRYDFTTTVLRSGAAATTSNEAATPPVQSELLLDGTEINNHESMATLCALIENIFNTGISELPGEHDDDVALPFWLADIRNILLSNDTHRNVKIFLVKLVENMKEIFRRYAKHLMEPLMLFITEKCAGDDINYFVVDVITMVAEWSNLVRLQDMQQTLAADVLRFLIKQITIFNNLDMFKYHLELVKMLTEAWKSFIEVPVPELMEKLGRGLNDRKLDEGIHLTSIYCANKVVFEAGAAEMFQRRLLSIMGTTVKSIYKLCAETLGLFYNNLDEAQQTAMNPALQAFLRAISGDNDKYVCSLDGISSHYPAVINEFHLCKLLGRLQGAPVTLKVLYLKIIWKRTELLGNVSDFKNENWSLLLDTNNYLSRLITLKIIQQTVDVLQSSEYFQQIIETIRKNINDPNANFRSTMYDLLKIVYKQPNVGEDIKAMCRDMLIQGLIDNEVNLRQDLYDFWSDQADIPVEITPRFSFLLSQFYNVKTEDLFLGHISYFLLSILNKSEEYNEVVFEHPLEDCKFEDYELMTRMRRQNRFEVSLFAETLQSHFGDSTFGPSQTPIDYLRNTLSSLAFAPTQSVSLLENSLKNFTQNDADYSVQLFGETLAYNRNTLPATSTNRRRFITNKIKIRSHFANLAVNNRMKMEQKRFDAAKEQGQNVKIYRKYRKGDLPDIQIQWSAIFKPLQILAQHDSEIAKILLTVLFKSLLSKSEDQTFIENVSASIKNIFNNSTMYNTNLFRVLFDVILENVKKITFDPNAITHACHSTGLISNGTLILEEYLINYDYGAPCSKIGSAANDDNLEISYWVKLAELYKEIDEWGVIRAIFLEKMSCNEIVKDAIKWESNGHFRNAQESYKKLIEVDLSDKRKDFYYESYFRCFASLGEWDNLPDVIASAVASDASIFDSLWDGDWYQKKLMPWFINGHIKTVLFKQECQPAFLAGLNDWLMLPEKHEYLQANFSEELCMLALSQDETEVAIQYLRYYIDNFLDNWQYLSEQFQNLRYNKILKLRNLIDAEKFLDVYKQFDDETERKVADLEKAWINSSKEILPTMILNENRLLCRTQFIRMLQRKCCAFDLNENLAETKFKLDLDLINTAVELKNFYVARKYIKTYEKKQNDAHNFALANILCLDPRKTTPLEKLPNLLEAGKMFGNILDNSQDGYLKQSACLKLFDVLVKLSEIYEANPDEFSANSLICSVARPQDYANYGFDRLKKLVEHYENDVDNSMDVGDVSDTSQHHHRKIAEAYVKLTYFVRQSSENHEEFIRFVLRGMKFGSLEAKQLFPCILMEDDLGERYKDLFVRESNSLPLWMFLGWIPQLLANVDSMKIFAISSLIEKIAIAYPQSIMYAYRLSKENYKIIEGSSAFAKEANKLIKRLDAVLLTNAGVDDFLKALSNVCVPVVKLQYYVLKMITAAGMGSFEEVCEKRDLLLQQVYEDETNALRESDNLKGKIFKIIDEFKERFVNFNGKNCTDILRDLRSMCGRLDKMIPKNVVDQLKNYSPWLSNFSAVKLNLNLEIPGQYDGTKLPLVRHHIKIAGFSPEVTIMISNKRPIKLTLRGMDAKEYPFLVKFGEDIRLDQRIQQLFNLMNDIFRSDLPCAQNDLNLMTYQVIPLTSSLGLIQWINNTTSLNEFIEKSTSPATFKAVFDKSYAFICDGNPNEPLKVSYQRVAKANRQKIIQNYQCLVSELPWDLLRSSFWTLSSNTENFIALRNNFVKTYAVICITHWILGIGDRHLTNSLICVKSGKVLSIDFGRSFGTATQFQTVPELVPFRLTPQILNLMAPFYEHAFYKDFMTDCLRSLRGNSDSLLATMNVFIAEPSLDWLEQASRLENNDEAPQNINWYPMEKIGHARRKLQGASSTSIMLEELHGNAWSPEENLLWVQGEPEFNWRARLNRNDNLSVEEQVDCLIDHATDRNLLGRMYFKWGPWV